MLLLPLKTFLHHSPLVPSSLAHPSLSPFLFVNRSQFKETDLHEITLISSISSGQIQRSKWSLINLGERNERARDDSKTRILIKPSHYI